MNERTVGPDRLYKSLWFPTIVQQGAHKVWALIVPKLLVQRLKRIMNGFWEKVANKGMERTDSICSPFWGPKGKKSIKQYKISIVLVNDV